MALYTWSKTNKWEVKGTWWELTAIVHLTWYNIKLPFKCLYLDPQPNATTTFKQIVSLWNE